MSSTTRVLERPAAGPPGWAVRLGAADEALAGVPARLVRSLPDEELLELARDGERVGRLVDALRVAAAAEVADRSRPDLDTGRLSTRKGCRSATELLERVTLAASATIGKRVRLGEKLRTRHTLAGFDLAPSFPRVAAAVAAGEVGLDSAEAIIAGLGPALPRVDAETLAAAEAELVRAATGAGEDTPVPATADELRIQAQVWRAYLDPDGVRPDEDHAMLSRFLRFGRERDGLIPVTGAILPEIAAKVRRLFDAHLAPTTAPVAFPGQADPDPDPAAQSDPAAQLYPAAQSDPAAQSEEQIQEAIILAGIGRDDRTTDQKRHDIFAAVIDAAARSADAPTVGGAAPTVLVSVRQADLDRGRGAGYIDGLDTPISLQAVHQFLCAGGAQKVLQAPNGAILQLGTEQRCFNRGQRRAISLRDGGCIVPGCTIPAGWTEIHHVDEHATGGPTHTRNGACLCWFHHRTLGSSGWAIRMHNDTPELQAPVWLDPTRKWRPATKSRTTLRTTLGE
jgi:Domain of unknown function (DUF222)